MWAVITQSTEGPDGTKRWRKGQFSLPLYFWAGRSVFFCPLNLEFLVLGPLDPKLYTTDSPGSQTFVNWITPLTFLLFQLADRLQDSWAFIGLCEQVSIINLAHIYLEKAMAPHSSTLAWKIPWTEESGSLQSMGSLRVRHDWATSLSLFTCMHWRGKWQPTPVFLPGESQGQGSLVGCLLWGCTELDMTEAT